MHKGESLTQSQITKKCDPENTTTIAAISFVIFTVQRDFNLCQ